MSDVTVTLSLSGEGASVEDLLQRIDKGLKKVAASGGATGAAVAGGMAGATGAMGATAGAATAAGAALGRMGQLGAGAGNAVSSSAQQAGRSLQTLTGIAENARSAIYGIFIVGRGLDYIKSISDIADSYTNLTSKIRNVTNSESEMADVRQRLFEVSQRTRTQMDATATLYTRLQRSTTALHLSDTQLVQLTETLNQSFLLGGATADESRRAIIQLTQAFNLGALRGQDFNSVASQAPVIMQLLRDSLHKTQGELKTMATQNQLTADVVVKAVQEGAPKVAAAFANVNTTIEGGMVRVHNAFEKYIGDANNASGASRQIVDALTSVANNIGPIVSTAIKAGEALALIYSGRALSGPLQFAGNVLTSVQALQSAAAAGKAAAEQAVVLSAAQEAAAISSLNEANARAAQNEADVVAINEMRQLEIASVNLAVATEAGALAALKESQAAYAQAAAHAAAAKAAGAQSYAIAQLEVAQSEMVDAQVRSVISSDAAAQANLRLSAATNELARLSLLEATAIENEALAMNAAVDAQARLTAAKVAGATATAEVVAAQTAWNLALVELQNLGGKAFALIGGWPTVVLAVVYAMYKWIDATTDVSKSVSQLTSATDQMKAETIPLENILKSLVTGEQAHATSLRDTASAELEKAKAELELLSAGRDMTRSLGDNGVALGFYSLKLHFATSKVDELQKKIISFDMANFTQMLSNAAIKIQEFWSLIHPSALDNLVGDAKLQAQMEKLRKTTLDAAAAEEVRIITQKKGNLAGLEAAAVWKLGLDSVDQLSEGLKNAIAVQAGYKDELDAIKQSHKDANSADRDAAKLAREAINAVNTEESGYRSLAAATNDYLGVKNKLADIEGDYANDLAKNQKTYDDIVAASNLLQEGDEGQLKALNALNAANDAAHDKMVIRLEDLTVNSDEIRKAIAIQKSLTTSYERLDAEFTTQIASNESLASGNDRLSSAQQKVLEYTAKLTEGGRQLTAVDQQHVATLQDLATVLTATNVLSEINKPTEFQNTLNQLDEVKKAMNLAFNDPKMFDQLKKTLNDPDLFKHLQDGADKLKLTLGSEILASTGAALTGLQSLTQQGSKYFEILNIAIKGVAVAQAVVAVLTQGEGEPYSAFFRMAAMVATVTPLLASIGASIHSLSASGPDANSAAVRQQTQGTGTVLGDANKQSESITNAVEITANATTQLVGLNRGMLDALHALQSALGAAGTQLANGAANTPTPNLSEGAGSGLDPLGSLIIGGIFGGSQKVIDQGIIIAGGALQDMINNIVIGAYQTIHTSGGLFSSGSDSDQISSVSDEFGKQFQLVIKSIADTVREGALALGLLPDQIDAAMSAFRVAEQRISLEGLSAEDQQKAIEAVFSSLFDGLAAAVVPFIAQFQKVGEGLGETLVRVASEVQVTQEAFKELGISVDIVDPEKFAQLSDSLVEAAGGLDAFISGLQSFIKNFSPESQQVAVMSDSLSSALAQVGLTLPSTKDGMWQLMQSLDATTEAGQKQIATLLSLADASNSYYTALDNLKKDLQDAGSYLYSLGISGGLSDFGQQLASIADSEQKAVDAANLLAEAQGREGASAAQIAQIHQWAADQIIAAIKALKAQVEDEISQLYGSGLISNAQTQATQTSLNQINQVSDAQHQLYTDQLNALKQIQDFLDSMQYGALSGLSPEQQLQQAHDDFYALQARALTGDPEAMAQLADAAQQYLQLAQGAYASGNDYNQIYNTVRAMLEQITQQGTTVTDPGTGQTTGGTSVTQQQQADAAEQAINRRELAAQLVQHLRDLSEAINTPIFDLINQLHVPLTQLVTDLGINLQDVTASSVQALAQLATDLGVPLGDLVTQLGIGLPDLQAGILELTNQLGINLNNLTAQTADQLAGLAQNLGVSISDLTTALGIDLGALADVNSPIFQAISSKIADLPPDQANALQPYLDAIANATTQADANAAVDSLHQAIEDNLPANIANSLEPFFTDPTYQQDDPQLDVLNAVSSASDTTNTLLTATNDHLASINMNLRAANDHSGIHSYALGTNYVPRDMLANIHEGEMVIDRNTSNLLRNYGIRIQAPANDRHFEEKASIAALIAEVKALRAELAAASAANVAGQRTVATTVASEGQRAYSQRDSQHKDRKVVRSK